MDDILAFLAVAERGSFTAAAALLRQPKTTVSRHVRTLEASLGVRLIDRTTRSLILTEAGELYRARLATLPGTLEEAARAVAELAGEPSGWLRITLPHALATNLVVPVIAAFGAHYPRVRFDLRLGHEVLDPFSDPIDIALRLGPLPDSSLVARRLGHLPNRIYAAPSYLERHGAPESPAELVGHACLANRTAQRLNGHAWALDDGGGLRDVVIEPVVVADDPDALKGALAAGRGLMLATDLVVRDLVASGRATPVLPGWVGRSPPLHALFPAGRAQLAKTRLFLDFLVQQVEQQGLLSR